MSLPADTVNAVVPSVFAGGANAHLSVLTIPVIVAQPLDVGAEAALPVRVARERDGAGVVRPVLEQAAVLFAAGAEEAQQQRRGVAREPAPQDEVVGARDGVDAVKLHEAQVLDQAQHRLRRGAAAGIREQALGTEEQAARGGGGEQGERGHGVLCASGAAPSCPHRRRGVKGRGS